MKIILYSNPDFCYKCKILEKMLQEKKFKYEEVKDVSIMISKGFLAPPILQVDDTIMTYGTAYNWINNYQMEAE